MGRALDRTRTEEMSRHEVLKYIKSRDKSFIVFIYHFIDIDLILHIISSNDFSHSFNLLYTPCPLTHPSGTHLSIPSHFVSSFHPFICLSSPILPIYLAIHIICPLHPPIPCVLFTHPFIHSSIYSIQSFPFI